MGEVADGLVWQVVAFVERKRKVIDSVHCKVVLNVTDGLLHPPQLGMSARVSARRDETEEW